jgi:glycosyltransferase involved in cell wall biosynthesis
MTAEKSAFRLLCVSHYFESHRGGIEMVAGQLARRLAQTGMAVTWAASDASPAPTDLPSLPLRASNLIERRCGLPFPVPGPLSLGRLMSAIRSSDAVLVHDGMYATSIAAIVTARLHGLPVVLVQHIGHVPGSSAPLRILFAAADRFLTRPMLRLASQVVFISDTSARHFARVRTRREPMLIFNGINSSVFRPAASQEQRRREREQVGWPGDRPVMLFVGRFLEKKGLLRLRELAAMRPDLHWAFAGWGPCDPAGWSFPNVSVHRNRSGAELASLYRAADLLVLPSKSEGFPLVIQEALACGLRPLCCDDAGKADPAAARHMVSVSNDGSESRIVKRYLEAIQALLADDTADERASRAGFARERYSWESAARSYRALLFGLCASARTRPHRENVPA